MLTLVAALKGFREDFCEFGYWNGTSHNSPTQVVTVFTPNGGVVASVLITQLRLYTACAAGSHELPPKGQPSLTVLGRSIGGVGIGMTEHDVLELLGTPTSTLKITLGGDKSGRSVRYTSHGAPLLISYDSSGRVISIEAYSRFFRTVGGLGPGYVRWTLSMRMRVYWTSGPTSASSATGTARQHTAAPTNVVDAGLHALGRGRGKRVDHRAPPLHCL